jgi:hypothetical protein
MNESFTLAVVSWSIVIATGICGLLYIFCNNYMKFKLRVLKEKIYENKIMCEIMDSIKADFDRRFLVEFNHPDWDENRIREHLNWLDMQRSK